MDAGIEPGYRVAGRYRLVAEIGAGGMGRVWEAVDEQLDRTVAVKQVAMPLLPPEHRAVQLEQAQREGRNAAALADHPNIVTVHDVVIEGGVPWIIMQLVRGRSLRAVLQGGQETIAPLSTDRVAEIAEAMLNALAALHKAGMVHRDIKPGNILMADDGRILLTDFGLAKAKTDATVTVSGTVMGTMAYIAPERVEGAGGTIKSDLFSLGVVLFEAIEGASPFYQDTMAATLAAILVNPVPPMRRAGWLAPLIEALTRKSPQERPGVDQAMALLKAAAIAGDGAPAVDPTVPGIPAAPAQDQARMPWQSVPRLASAGLPRPPLLSTTQPADPGSGSPRTRPPRLLVVGVALLVMTSLVGLGAVWAHAGRHQPGRPPLTLTTPNVGTGRSATGAGDRLPASTPLLTSQDSSGTPAEASTAPSHPPVVPAATAVAVRQLDAPDFQGYCRATGQGDVVLDPSLHAYGWRCTADNGTGDDAEAVCRWTNHISAVTNRVADFNNPDSWQCWAVNRDLGPIDWNVYCQDKGYSGAQDLGLNDAYTWVCAGAPHQALDSQDACRTLYGTDAPVSRFQNFYDKNTWQCWT